MSRANGPICGSEVASGWIDDGTNARTRSATPRAEGNELNSHERELLLDLTQMVLDLTGILDPTPTSDGTNVVISLGRGDWLGAGLSGLGLIPYIGDLAKAGKLGRWAQTLKDTVAQARRNPAFAARVRGLLRSLSNILEQVPDSMLPAGARAPFLAMRKQLDEALGIVRGADAAALLARYKKLWLKHIDELPLVSPGPDRGALWSKLSAKMKTDPGYFPKGDAEDIAGWALAARLASQEGKQTLEMVLAESKFIEKYELAVRQLAEKLARKPDTLWQDFGQVVWASASAKYARTLKGRVTVFVDDEVLRKALAEQKLPLLSIELQELLKRRRSGDGVTKIVVKDIFDGTIFEI
jgi:hypothetical protein